jgi:hypothetical protein
LGGCLLRKQDFAMGCSEPKKLAQSKWKTWQTSSKHPDILQDQPSREKTKEENGHLKVAC